MSTSQQLLPILKANNTRILRAKSSNYQNWNLNPRTIARSLTSALIGQILPRKSRKRAKLRCKISLSVYLSFSLVLQSRKISKSRSDFSKSAPPQDFSPPVSETTVVGHLANDKFNLTSPGGREFNRRFIRFHRFQARFHRVGEISTMPTLESQLNIH